MLWFPARFGGAAIFGLIHSALSPVAAAQLSANATDCSRAETASERAICANPDLAAADAAMANAYFTLGAALPRDQKAVLLDDQRRWVRVRDARCGDQNEPEQIACLLKETNRRRQFFIGEATNGARSAPLLQPGFFREARKGRYEINVIYPRTAKPANAGEDAFRAVHNLVLGKAALGETRGSQRVPGAPMPSSYDASYEVTYLGANLAAIVFSISTHGAGAAHPLGSRESLIFDLALGRRLTLGDIFTSPKEAVSAVSERCKSQLEAQAAKGDWQLFDHAAFAAVVSEVRYWAPDQTGVDILFDPYSVAAYAFGEHQCRLSWDDLLPWLKANGPLPPR